MQINSKEDWWSLVIWNWEKLEKIILHYYPNQASFPEEGWPIPYPTLGSAQRACNAVIKHLRKEKPIWSDEDSLKEYINSLKEKKDVGLAEILEDTWYGLPETPSVREMPGFFMFCDLCSESVVLQEKEYNGFS